MLKEEVIEFLEHIMPFNFLTEQELAGIVEEISMEYYPRGIKVLTQDGPPSKHLHIIKKGGVKIFITAEDNEETIIDYRSEGEIFGLLSVIGGDRSRTNIITVEDTICYLIPKEKILLMLQSSPEANEYFLKSFFLNFIDKTYEKTREKYSGMTRDEQLLYTTPVGQVVRRSPVTARQDLTIRQAAQKMAKNKISSLIIVNDASTDNSAEIAGSFKDQRIRVISKEMGRSRREVRCPRYTRV